MSTTVPFLSPAWLGVALVGSIAAAALVPPAWRRWWLVLGAGMSAACVVAAAGGVPWTGELHLTGYSVAMLAAFVAAYLVTVPRARILGIGERTVIDLFIVGLIGGLVGARIGEVGNFWEPTVLDDVSLDAKVFNDEPFGPVAAIRGFATLDDAIAEANRLPYGLAGYAFTRSLKNAHQLSQRVEVGMLWVNQPALPVPEMPFGGVKDSGYGSEGGPEALDAYLVTKTVSINCS